MPAHICLMIYYEANIVVLSWSKTLCYVNWKTKTAINILKNIKYKFRGIRQHENKRIKY